MITAIKLIVENSLATIAVIGAFLGLIGTMLSLNGYRQKFHEAKRLQAEKIGAWWVRVDPDKELKLNGKHFNLPVSDPDKYYVGIQLSNGSSVPVYNIVVGSIAYEMEDGERRRVPSMIPGDTGKTTTMRTQTTLTLPMLPPGDVITFAIDEKDYQKSLKQPWAFPEPTSATKGKTRPIINDLNWRVTTIRFQDASGAQWLRGQDALGFTTGAKDSTPEPQRDLISASHLAPAKYDFKQYVNRSVYTWMISADNDSAPPAGKNPGTRWHHILRHR